MKSSLPALSTPVTCAPARLASWIANEPEPPPAPLISTRCPAPAPAVPCSAIAPACGIVDASANVSSGGLRGQRRLRRDRVLGEAALEREVVAVHLVARPEPGDAGPTAVDPPGDVRAERPRAGERSPPMRAYSRASPQASQSLRLTDVAATLTSTCPAAGGRDGHVLDPQHLAAARTGRRRPPSSARRIVGRPAGRVRGGAAVATSSCARTLSEARFAWSSPAHSQEIPSLSRDPEKHARITSR